MLEMFHIHLIEVYVLLHYTKGIVVSRIVQDTNSKKIVPCILTSYFKAKRLSGFQKLAEKKKSFYDIRKCFLRN